MIMIKTGLTCEITMSFNLSFCGIHTNVNGQYERHSFETYTIMYNNGETVVPIPYIVHHGKNP